MEIIITLFTSIINYIDYNIIIIEIKALIVYIDYIDYIKIYIWKLAEDGVVIGLSVERSSVAVSMQAPRGQNLAVIPNKIGFARDPYL